MEESGDGGKKKSEERERLTCPVFKVGRLPCSGKKKLAIQNTHSATNSDCLLPGYADT